MPRSRNDARNHPTGRLDSIGHCAAEHTTLPDVPAIVDRDDLIVRGSVNGLVLIGAKQGGQQ